MKTTEELHRETVALYHSLAERVVEEKKTGPFSLGFLIAARDNAKQASYWMQRCLISTEGREETLHFPWQ